MSDRDFMGFFLWECRSYVHPSEISRRRMSFIDVGDESIDFPLPRTGKL